MITFVFAVLSAMIFSPPPAVTIATPRGEIRVIVERDHNGAPIVPAHLIFTSLGGMVNATGAWAEASVPGQSFRFLVGTPYYRIGDRVLALASPMVRRGDSLFVPLQFLTETLPQRFTQRYHYDGRRARFTEIGGSGSVLQAGTLPNGLVPGHLVTIDPGHGGSDPGNPGKYFPKGVQEKHVTLQVGLLVRNELQARGVVVRMTRTTDVRTPLLERAPMCSDGCDLFVSIHVDALPSSRRDYKSIRGFHTLIIGEKNSADATRVARMENESLRYEIEDGAGAEDDALSFIFKDLSRNEYLIESANAAEIILGHLDEIHSGENLGVRQTNRLAVLNTAQRPALLVEMGYATNRQDAQLMRSPSGQRKIAGALADAIVQYLIEYDRKTGAGAAAGAGK
jgi:N-acetylmuramoyl-L-alanine amidase